MKREDVVTELRKLAAEYTEAETQVDSLELARSLSKGEAQVRFVATLVAAHPGIGDNDRGYYTDLGEAWISAGRRFLEALMRQAEDEVHASRAARRVEL